jgi:hypothetical protein
MTIHARHTTTRTGKIQFLAKAFDGTGSFGKKLSPLWDNNLKNAPNSAAVYFAKNALKYVLAKPLPPRSKHFLFSRAE